MTRKKEITALIPYFGCNRLLAESVGEELAGAKWVAIPFAGGMPELAFISAPTVVVSDVHRHVINLATVAACPYMGPILYRRLRRIIFHEDILAAAQEWCRTREFQVPDLTAAEQYFLAAWQGRSAKAGTGGEFNGKLPIRFTFSGGDSATRFQSAVRALPSFRRIAARCSFTVADAFDVIAKVPDEDGFAIYCDAPFPDKGKEYRHKFTNKQQDQLEDALHHFRKTRVVCRFHDHKLIRQLYSADRWTWCHATGRNQANDESAELLLINGPSHRKG